MIDFGIFTTPIILAAAIFGFTLVTDTHEIVFEPVQVPLVLEERGYSPDVVTGALAAGLRDINRTAASYRGSVYKPDGNEDKSIELLSSYFEIDRPVRILQKSLGLVPLQISGNVVAGEDGGLRLQVRGSGSGRSFVVQRTGTAAEIDSMIRDASLEIMWNIDPYIAMLYEYRVEVPKKEFPRTLAAIERCLMVCKEDDMRWLQVVWGLTLFNQGRFDEAVGKYKRAIELDPGMTRPRYLWGAALASRGQHDEAIAKFREVIAIDSGYAPAYAAWGGSLTAKGELVRAEEQFRLAVYYDPRLADAHAGWARLRIAQGRLDDAVAKLRRALDLAPGNKTYTDELAALIRRVEPTLQAVAAKP